MNFLFFFNTLNAFGGAERQAIILMEYLLGKGHRATVLAFEDGQKVKEILKGKNIPVIIYPLKYYCPKWKKLIHYQRLIKIIRNNKADILVPYVAESNKIAAELFPFTGAKFVFWNQREEGRELYGTSKEKKLLQRVTAIVSNSNEGQYFIHKTYNIPTDKIHVINNGILIPQNFSKRNVWHEKLGLDPDDQIISMIANITERKNHETLIKAWAQVIKEYKGGKRIFLVLAGKPKIEILNRLKVLGFDLKLCNHIKFVEFVDDVNALLQESYFCVFSSNLEGCPNGVLEAMSMKKAVIATDIRGNRQALGEDFVTEELARPNDPADFAMKIVNLLHNEEMVNQLAHKNFKRIKDHFSVEQMAHGYLSLIKIPNK